MEVASSSNDGLPNESRLGNSSNKMLVEGGMRGVGGEGGVGRVWGCERGGRGVGVKKREGMEVIVQSIIASILSIHRELSTTPPLFHHPHPTLSLMTTLTLLDECVCPPSLDVELDPLALAL